MSDNKDDPVTGRSESTEFTTGEVEPRYARSERLDRRSEPLPQTRERGGLPVPAPGQAVAARRRTPLLVAVIVLLLLVIIVLLALLLLRPAGGGEAATTSTTPTSTSSTKPASPSLPTTTAGTTTAGTSTGRTSTGGTTAPPAGGAIPPTVTLTYRSYVDLDTMYPSTESNGQDEVWVDENAIEFGQSGMWAKTRVVLVPTGGISKDACDHSTVLATGGRLQKDQVGSDQSICVATSGGKWVVLTSTDHQFSADDPVWHDQYSFATQVFPGPQPT